MRRNQEKVAKPNLFFKRVAQRAKSRRTRGYTIFNGSKNDNTDIKHVISRQDSQRLTETAARALKPGKYGMKAGGKIKVDKLKVENVSLVVVGDFAFSLSLHWYHLIDRRLIQ